MLNVTYFYREPRKTGFSIEGIFNLVKDCLKEKVAIKEFYCDPKLSRFQNTLHAARISGEINHITGDVNFLALGFIGKKNILTVHDMGHYDTLRNRPLVHLIYKYFWYKLPLLNIDIVTVVSEFTREKLIKYTGFPLKKIRLIPDPVKPIFRFIEKKKLNQNPRILILGTGRHKNLSNLAIAVKDSIYHIDIVGFPSEAEKELLNQYSISHSIYNSLSDEDIYARYIECDILFIASFYEGFGMPIIEAQSVGRPVITSNIGAMKEVAGDTAILVDPNQPAAIRRAIDQLVNDNSYYCKMVDLGRKNIAPYQYQKIAGQYLAVYYELINKN